jgi:hypothetical protein
VTEIQPAELAERLRPALVKLRGESDIVIGLVGGSCLVRLESMSLLTAPFVVELLKFQNVLKLDGFIVDEGENGGCMDVSNGGVAIIKAFENYQVLFAQVYDLLET